ncbi:hypothetical protein EJ02DRAFT_438773, partial [Clathrospora elynae]
FRPPLNHQFNQPTIQPSRCSSPPSSPQLSASSPVPPWPRRRRSPGPSTSPPSVATSPQAPPLSLHTRFKRLVHCAT